MDRIDPFPPSTLGEWRTLSEAGRQRWLEMAGDRHFARSTAPVPVRGRVVTIEGSDIVDLATFLCAMGEAVNGPGGYFGSSWAAFDDCLFGGFGLESPAKIVWKNAAKSRQAMDSTMLVAWCEREIAAIDHGERPEPYAEGRASLVATLALARRGERTFFDELVATIESVPARYLHTDWVLEVILEYE